jgi:hypothetical protein
MELVRHEISYLLASVQRGHMKIMHVGCGGKGSIFKFSLFTRTEWAA